MCVYALRGTVGNLEGILFVNVDDTICGEFGSLFSKALTTLRNRFPFRKWQVGERMLCGSKYVQNKDTKDIVISQTEFAVKITKVPMSPARKKKKKDPADEAEIHAFRGVSGSICWIHVRMCLVKCLNCNRLCHNQLWRRSVRQAWWFAEYTRMPTCVSRSDECQYKT